MDPHLLLRSRSAAMFAILATMIVTTGARAELNPQPRPSTATIAPVPGRAAAMVPPFAATLDPGLYLDKTWPGWINYPNSLDPPDCHGAAGEHGILEINNRSVSYVRKDGTPYWRSSFEFDFWILYQRPGNMCDPRGIYDPQLKRFFLTNIQTRTDFVSPPPRCHVSLAVSKTDHPLSQGPDDWWFYRFDVTQFEGATPFGLDYPALACDDHALYLVGNLFQYPLTGGNLRNSMVVCIDKALAAQGVLSYKLAQTPPDHDFGRGFTLQPARLVGGAPTPGGIEYFAEVPYDGPVNRIRLWALQDPLGSPTMRDTLIVVPSWVGFSASAPQCIAGDVRTWSPTAQGNAFWRDGSLWFCHTSAAVDGRAVVRYYRVDTNGWPAGSAQLAESGTIDPGAGQWAYQPAIGGNQLGDVAMVFTESGVGLCPTPMYSAYRAGSAGFTAPAPLTTDAAGSPTYLWGDYGTVAEDPVDHSLWVGHERHLSTLTGDWTQQWGHLRFDDDAAGWPDSGRVVRAGQVEARDACVLPSAAGSALVLWREMNAVYAQRLNADGSRAAGWPARGRLVCADPVDHFRACSDSAGGAYLTWTSFHGGRVVRIDSEGVPVAGWPSAGIAFGMPDALPQMAGSSSGVVLGWNEAGAVVQRISPAGQVMWGANGLNLDADGWSPAVTPDGAGGALVAWAPGRGQHVSSGGAVLWPAAIDLVAEGDVPQAVSDGAGGMIAVFQTAGADGLSDLVAQRVTGSGALATGWPSAGAAMCTHAGAQTEAALLADGAGGLFATWRDQRAFAGSRSDVYAVRLASDGQLAPGWASDGVPVCTAPGYQFAPSLATDGANGIRIVWEDHRVIPSCLTGTCNSDVYMQRLLPDGSADAMLPLNGAAVSSATGNQALPSVAMLGGGRSLVVWNDGRGMPDCVPWCTDAVVARLYIGPSAAGPSASRAPVRALELAVPEPNPVAREGGRATLRFAMADTHRDAPLRLEIYDLSGRRLRTLASGAARTGVQRATWDLRDADGRLVGAGLYFVRLRVGATQVTRNLMVW